MTTRHPTSRKHRALHRDQERFVREWPSYTEIRIKGRLSGTFVAALGQLGAELQPWSTVLAGDLDNAALFALLDRIGALGLELVEVRRFQREDFHPGSTHEKHTP